MSTIRARHIYATMVIAMIASTSANVPEINEVLPPSKTNKHGITVYAVGEGSGGGLQNKKFCQKMATRALPTLKEHFLGDEKAWRKVRNAAKRRRKAT